MMSAAQHIPVSLFRLLREELGDRLPITKCTKATLVHISHALEEVVLKNELSALIFTGFQESSHWRQETERYRKLAEIVHQVCIFAGGKLPPESMASQIHVQLLGDDPLRQEWFLLILSDRFSVLLCGLDNLKPVDEEAVRVFDTIWTFDVLMIDRALDKLEDAVACYRPDRLADLQKARDLHPPRKPDVNMITRLMIDLVRFEEKLNEQIRWQKSIADSLIASIEHQLYISEASVDTSTRGFDVVFGSPKFPQLLGLPATPEKLPDWDWLESRVVEKDRAIFREHLTRLWDGRDSLVEYRYRKPDGTIIWLQDDVRVQFDQGQNIHRLYGVMKDIGERKAMEAAEREQERLEAELAQERQLSAMKSYFMSTVSHEFRTPLATVLSATEVLTRYSDRLTQEERDQRLKKIQNQVLQIAHMLDEISDTMQGRFEKITLNPVRLEPFALIQEKITQFVRQNRIAHPISFNHTGDDQPIMADPSIIGNIITNLLMNATTYTLGPSPDIQVTSQLSGKMLEIVVEDNGIGIPADEQGYVFDLFYRATNARHIAGIGLGLGIARDCALAHGGEITFTSVESSGSVFTATLAVEMI